MSQTLAFIAVILIILFGAGYKVFRWGKKLGYQEGRNDEGEECDKFIQEIIDSAGDAISDPNKFLRVRDSGKKVAKITEVG